MRPNTASFIIAASVLSRRQFLLLFVRLCHQPGRDMQCDASRLYILVAVALLGAGGLMWDVQRPATRATGGAVPPTGFAATASDVAPAATVDATSTPATHAPPTLGATLAPEVGRAAASAQVPGPRRRALDDLRLTGPEWALQVPLAWSNLVAAIGDDVSMDAAAHAGSVPDDDAADRPAVLRPRLRRVMELRHPCGRLVATVDWTSRVAEATQRALVADALPPVLEAQLPNRTASGTRGVKVSGLLDAGVSPHARLPIVYVEQHLLRAFVTRFLPEHAVRVRHRVAMPHQPEDASRRWFPRGVPALPLVVVTACSDTGPRRFLAGLGLESGFQDALDSVAVHRWYADQCDARHPKLRCVPIGVGFHAAIQRGHGDHPVLQAEALRGVADAADALGSRSLHVVADPWSDSNNPARASVRAALRQALPPSMLREVVASASTSNKRLHRHDLWRAYASAAFVASPPGIGWDCHRTWEALTVGAIPLLWSAGAYRRATAAQSAGDVAAAEMSEGSEEQVLDGLPVVVVERYGDITPAFLRRHHANITRRMRRGDFAAPLRRLRSVTWVLEVTETARLGLKHRLTE